MPRGKRDRGDGSAEPALTGPADPSVDISDCTFLLTGALSVLRSEMEAEIRSNGGKVGSISKSTHLLCGPDGFGTNKYNQAERKGLPVVDESWVRSLFDRGAPALSPTESEDSSNSGPAPGAARDLADGETTEVQGSADEPYRLKRLGAVYSCTCPAWRYQSKPINQRTCKHLKMIRGASAEAARIGHGEMATTARVDRCQCGSAYQSSEANFCHRCGAPRVKTRGSGGDAGQGPASGGGGGGGKPGLLLAQPYTGKEDVTGWLVSEKLDGLRAYWNGLELVSRGGNVFDGAPEWFTSVLPEDMPLDGELFAGRGKFDVASSIVRTAGTANEARWKELVFSVFDAPGEASKEAGDPGFEKRLAALESRLAGLDRSIVRALKHEVCSGADDLSARLEAVEREGGEGLMLRQPGSRYVGRRSSTLLKVKTFHDREAIVVGYRQGKGRHGARTGALKCELPDGTAFACGSGLSDAERDNPPAIGAVITFRYFEMTKAGVPRFPTFVRERPGFAWPPSDD